MRRSFTTGKWYKCLKELENDQYAIYYNLQLILLIDMRKIEKLDI